MTSADARDRMALMARLQRALTRDELELHYQPIVDAASGSIVAAEALLRWNDPEHGLVPPGVFIPAAEATGVIRALAPVVIDGAVRQAATWRKLGIDLQVMLNLSPEELRAPELPGLMSAALERHGADAGRITVELTESGLMDETISVCGVVEKLVDLGVRVAIDDFGAGHSSLARLRDLPVHVLKIDRGFLRAVPSDARSTALLRSIVSLAHAIDLEVVVEGVETLAQHQVVVGWNCPLAQGFHYARPLPAAGLTAMLEEQRALVRAGAAAAPFSPV